MKILIYVTCSKTKDEINNKGLEINPYYAMWRYFMCDFESVKDYKKLVIIRKGLEYKYCLETDKDKKAKIKNRMNEVKLHIKILENSLGVLKPEEREVIYLAYFKQDFIFTGWTNVAVTLNLDISTVYKYKQNAMVKIENYLKAIDVDNNEYYSLKEKLEFNRNKVKLKRKRKNAHQIRFSLDIKSIDC